MGIGEIIKPIVRRTRPEVTESLEILKRERREKLINDQLAWEPPQPWKHVVNRRERR